MGSNEERAAAVGRALDAAKSRGLIIGWKRSPRLVAAWDVAAYGTGAELRSLREAEVYCAALASAWLGMARARGEGGL